MPPGSLFTSTRRKFIQFLLGSSAVAWLGSIIYPVIRYLIPPPDAGSEVSSAKVALINDLKRNSGKIVRFGNKPVMLIRKPDDSYAAFSGKCTHLDCNVQYRSDKERIWCACHNGEYDLNGLNVSGPPPRPLEELKVHIQGEDVYVSRKA